MDIRVNNGILCLTNLPLFFSSFIQKYPIVWQGLLALKNDTAAVQLHFVCGNKALAHRSLPLQEGGALLRIVQRMRLEASQLESVARRMTVSVDIVHCPLSVCRGPLLFIHVIFFFSLKSLANKIFPSSHFRANVSSVFSLLCHVDETKMMS